MVDEHVKGSHVVETAGAELLDHLIDIGSRYRRRGETVYLDTFSITAQGRTRLSTFRGESVWVLDAVMTTAHQRLVHPTSPTTRKSEPNRTSGFAAPRHRPVSTVSGADPRSGKLDGNLTSGDEQADLGRSTWASINSCRAFPSSLLNSLRESHRDPQIEGRPPNHRFTGALRRLARPNRSRNLATTFVNQDCDTLALWTPPRRL